MKKIKKSYEILDAHFSKLQKENKKFSKRALSQKLGMSHSFVISIFKGQRLLPLKRLDDVCEKLKIDQDDKNQLKNLILSEKNKLDINNIKSQIAPATAEAEYLPESHLKILRKWWNIALLDLISCYPKNGLDKDTMIKKLNINEIEIDISLNELKQLGLIRQDESLRYYKTSEHLKLVTRGPHPITRSFYKASLQLAQAELDKKSEKDFEKRLISSISCAVNPAQIPLAQKKLSEALREVRDILTEGECSDVYFLQAQMFSVLK